MADMPWGSPPSKKFATNVGLITTDGPHGPNIMAAEWTHHVSYEPGLIMICIHHEDATAQNIEEAKEFGVSLAAEGQNWVASIAGGSHGQDVDKVAVLRDLGVKFYKAKHIRAPMVKGAALNAECKVVQSIELGDHVAYVGIVLDVSVDEKAEAIAYHGGKYYRLGEPIAKPPKEFLDKIKKLVEKHRKQAQS
jgi:flavin reductase (DIM6/NTAB) family NADH-FMN oxidoreductase RutF